jgi:hypothetical protein
MFKALPTGRVNVALAVLPAESVTFTLRVTEVVPDGGTPVSTPAGLSVSHPGNGAAGLQLYPAPLQPLAAND